MLSWKETFEQCAENRSQLEQLFSPGPAVSCTRTFAILPLRYGVGCGSAAQRRALPELPPHLCRPHQVGELSEASYAIRPLREGFLYVLIKRASTGQYAWHSQYRISPLGTLDFIDPDKPWDTLASLNPLEAIRSMTWLFKIHDLDDVQDLRLLYSPDPLTQMTEVRIGSLVAVLEVWNLMVKADAADKRSREYIEIAAAMIGVSAAALELGATAAGFAERSGSAAVQQAGKMFRGGLRLSAGTLAGVAASVGAWYDFKDASKEFGSKNLWLASAYGLRAAVQTGVAGLSIAIGLAASGPFLDYMIKRHGSSAFMSSTLKVGVNTSKFLAARMVFMLRVFFGLNLLTFAITAGLMYFVPNDLQRYLSHSTFRKDRSKGIADTEEKEIEIMQRAVGSTL